MLAQLLSYRVSCLNDGEVQLDVSIGREVALLNDGHQADLVVLRNHVPGKPDIADKVFFFGEDGEVSVVQLDSAILDPFIEGAGPRAEEVLSDAGDEEAAKVVILTDLNSGNSFERGDVIFISEDFGRVVGEVEEQLAVRGVKGANVGQDFEALLDLTRERDVVADVGRAAARHLEQLVTEGNLKMAKKLVIDPFH